MHSVTASLYSIQTIGSSPEYILASSSMALLFFRFDVLTTDLNSFNSCPCAGIRWTMTWPQCSCSVREGSLGTIGYSVTAPPWQRCTRACFPLLHCQTEWTEVRTKCSEASTARADPSKVINRFDLCHTSDEWSICWFVVWGDWTQWAYDSQDSHCHTVLSWITTFCMNTN